jgi:MFS family permease
MDSSPPAAAPAAQVPLLINREYALLWGAGGISFIGDFVFDTTLILWIATRLAAGQSWAALAVGGLLLGVLVPSLILGPLAGVFVDRWDKRRTMLVMDALRAGVIFLLLLVPALGTRLPVAAQLGLVYTAVVLCTICAQFFGPARTALIGDVVTGEEARTKASALTQITIALAAVVGPPIAAPLFVGLGIQWALVINALSFAISFAAILAIRAPEAARSVAQGERGNVRREFTDGIRFFFSSATLMTITITVVVAMAGAGSLNALDVFFATVNLHASPALYGWLSAAFGTGAIVGGIGASVLAGRIGPARMFWFGVLAAGFGLLIYSRLTSFLPAAILLGVLGIPLSGVNAALMPILLMVTPKTMIGRVTGVLEPLVSLASIASIAVAAILVSTVLHGFHRALGPFTLGPVDTIFSAAAILCVIAGIYAMLYLRPEREARPNGLDEGVNAA